MRLPSKQQILAKVKILVSLGLVIAMLAVAAKLASAPLYRRYDAGQCIQAYAAARTRDDSSRVDLHPYRSPNGSRNARCGETRATLVDSLVFGRPSASR